ncbi:MULTISPECIES: DUF5340 domain-containing protein [Planktothricoides]|uniref:DUF5340 domain-containing protein n=2 Tax=Planktothricoides raciborskii TaxID=132608 RepID=A0AAU8JE96_9CYAN|nr:MULTISPECIES: DUF5340 domain-containing protein [Planktothricoides]KOR35439.1 hypothetical protein AM228_18465 [Planktothricoides sp. SR001]MBD2545908.1 DUF5340 domain-containing protein [Planktothricoides raciborskii FACHB-1370]MBD2584025.1 DUF5340 domain-containing protein [Planktothricoides raciborskii FACHB-1261]
MAPIPLPSHVHYELLLQLLERQTMFAVGQNSPQRDQVRQLIATLRKAFAQQKRLEESCQHENLAIEYRWSLNKGSGESREDASLTAPPPTLDDR